MPLKTRDLLTRSWQSQANLSLFLLPLILGEAQELCGHSEQIRLA